MLLSVGSPPSLQWMCHTFSDEEGGFADPRRAPFLADLMSSCLECQMFEQRL